MIEAYESIDSTMLIHMTTQIVSAYASKASLSPNELNDTIAAVASALRGVTGRPVAPKNPEQIPAVPIKKSVTPDFLICLEDGKKLKMLKRHLRSQFGMTPAEYRAKWNLPHDYPMTAPGYAATRAAVAKASGLGKRTGMSRSDPHIPPSPAQPPRRGRPKTKPVEGEEA